MQFQKTMLWKFLTAPFSENLAMYVCLLFILSAFNMADLISRRLYPYATYVLAYSIVASYLLILIYGIVKPQIAKRIYAIGLFSYTLIISIIDNVCQSQFMSHISKDFVAAFLGTNLSEANEFFATFITPKVLLTIIIYLIAAISVFLIIRSLKQLRCKALRLAGLLVVLASLGMTIRNSSVMSELPLDKIALLFQYDAPEDLHKYLTNPSVTLKEGLQPSNVVIIIGESFAKSHSSLYGYEKQTNPKLTAMRDSMYLQVFDNVTSPATGTIGAFKCIMSTYKPEYEDSIKWYTCTTLIEVLKKSGYHVAWFSNQSKNGFWDNEIGKYAELCDENYFVGNKYAGMSRTQYYDEMVIDLAAPNIDNVGKNVYFFHLMGSHPTYKHRYPENYDIYKAENYPDALSNQRQTLAEYDNSVLYNDSVLNEIISLFRQREAIVFYFSDHGQDIYNSSNEFCGHGIADNPESAFYGKQIPFMIYMSDAYKQKYPEVVEEIVARKEDPFRTDDFIYLLMDIIGVEFSDN